MRFIALKKDSTWLRRRQLWGRRFILARYRVRMRPPFGLITGGM